MEHFPLYHELTDNVSDHADHGGSLSVLLSGSKPGGRVWEGSPEPFGQDGWVSRKKVFLEQLGEMHIGKVGRIVYG